VVALDGDREWVLEEALDGVRDGVPDGGLDGDRDGAPVGGWDGVPAFTGERPTGASLM